MEQIEIGWDCIGVPFNTCNFGRNVSTATVDFWFIPAPCCSGEGEKRYLRSSSRNGQLSIPMFIIFSPRFKFTIITSKPFEVKGNFALNYMKIDVYPNQKRRIYFKFFWGKYLA